jgi:LysR family transcriptional regulator of beta-lactamase
VKALEDQLGRTLFRRTARGLVLTDEGAALMPAVSDAFAQLTRAIDAVRLGGPQEVVTVGVVGTFAVGFLIERIAEFRSRHPRIDLRLLTNNNKLDLATDNLDFGIQFGDGAWRSVDAARIMRAPLSPLCSRAVAKQLLRADDLNKFALLRSYRASDWSAWLAAAGVPHILPRGPVFDASTLMVQAAMRGQGIALAPANMFCRDIEEGRIVQPFDIEVDVGSYWLTRLTSKQETEAMAAFRAWVLSVV